jgi:hypothetical protein
MRPRLRRLLSALHRPGVPAPEPDPAGPEHASPGQASPGQASPGQASPGQASQAPDLARRSEAEQRFEDAQRRLKQTVPPRED